MHDVNLKSDDQYEKRVKLEFHMRGLAVQSSA